MGRCPPDPELRRAVAALQAPDARRSLAQVADTFLPFAALLAAMHLALPSAPWLLPLLVLPAAGLIVRIFVLQHDCGHGSLFRRRWPNDALGWLCSLFTLTPYAMWRRQHAGHHARWNDLDARDSGLDIYSTCLTVAEYRALSPWRRRLYRVVQHPVPALLVLPPFVFMLLYRWPFDAPRAWRRERAAVLLTNLALVALYGGLGLGVGFAAVALVHGPPMVIAAILGVWLFSLQHRFEGVAWARRRDWDPVSASIAGSSWLRLPRVLDWFTGSIGLHHIHHLAPRIPNYRLHEARHAHHALDRATSLSLWKGLGASRWALWDEDAGRMVRFADLPSR
ncbi:MAG: fatty acid desaturase [Acetobacteraceae bacterium]|nr:fatty acid desaturase [Acetobacteraceae bacterium]